MQIATRTLQLILTFGTIWDRMDRMEGKVQEKNTNFWKRDKRWVFGGPPQFHPETPVNVTAQLGGSAYLPCRIKNLGNKSVSWVRSRDSHILTVDRYTFIADERFVAWHDRATRSWTLMVKYVQERDAGRYECQVSTEPKMSHFINLNIIRPRVEISTDQDLYVKSGSRVTINCTIRNSIEVPQYIFWYHDSERIVGGNPLHEMQVRQIPPQTTVGSYAIKTASLKDSGNYTCEPAGLKNATVTLHVLAGEEPAAMQHGTNDATRESRLTSIGTLLLEMSVLFCWSLFSPSMGVNSILRSSSFKLCSVFTTFVFYIYLSKDYSTFDTKRCLETALSSMYAALKFPATLIKFQTLTELSSSDFLPEIAQF